MKTVLRNLILSALLFAPGAAYSASEDLDKIRASVIDCVSRMEVQTTWDQCRRLMFSPCEKEKVGSEEHVACLRSEKSYWVLERDKNLATVNASLTTKGSETLVDLTGQWISYVGQKCTEIAKSKSDISFQSAMTGCEISEIVGLNAELIACLDGRSTAPYCTPKE